jgi:hypothetical protein
MVGIDPLDMAGPAPAAEIPVADRGSFAVKPSVSSGRCGG